ncbi:MAG: exopolyphosphatase [bacterium]
MSVDKKKYRLVTRSDIDGLVCAVMLRELNMIDEITFVHPKDVQDGKIELTERDITTNVPYVNRVHLAFDHHMSETLRLEDEHKPNLIMDPQAPSTARVVYDYFGGKEKFQTVSPDMMAAVDKSDSAQFTMKDIMNPKGWELLSFMMDPRTGLGRFKSFRISNYDLMMKLIDYCAVHQNPEDILNLPDVKERCDLYFEYQDKFKDQIKCCSSVYENLVVLNLKNEEIIYPGNRFMIYALYPQCTISIYEIWGLKKQNTVFAIGKSIFNKTSTINIGELCLTYGGGGHENAGTCQIANERAHDILKELITRINDFEYQNAVMV